MLLSLRQRLVLFTMAFGALASAGGVDAGKRRRLARPWPVSGVAGVVLGESERFAEAFDVDGIVAITAARLKEVSTSP